MKYLFLFLLFTLISLYAIGQGCSDSGICSAGSFNANQTNGENHLSYIRVGTSFGLGENNVFIQTSSIALRIKILKNTFLHATLPYTFVAGDLGKTNGFGDITFSVEQNIYVKGDHRLVLNVGAKVATNNSDKLSSDRPLPMSYQTSLGTNDLIVGLTHSFKTWKFSVGYLHVFQANKNDFLHSRWPEGSPGQEYFESKNLRRGDDLMLRVEKRFNWNRHTFFIGIYPIFRIQGDKIRLEDESPLFLEGSKGLTLNIPLGYQYAFSSRFTLNILYASPLVWRKTRADGLERPFVLATILEYKF